MYLYNSRCSTYNNLLQRESLGTLKWHTKVPPLSSSTNQRQLYPIFPWLDHQLYHMLLFLWSVLLTRMVQSSQTEWIILYLKNWKGNIGSLSTERLFHELWMKKENSRNSDPYCIINISFKWIYLCTESYDIISKNDWYRTATILGIKAIKWLVSNKVSYFP